jgi:hypothetical protein
VIFLKKTLIGEVVTYYLSPEELEKYCKERGLSLPDPGKKSPKKRKEWRWPKNRKKVDG